LSLREAEGRRSNLRRARMIKWREIASLRPQ
jgi:hypothetical protein